MARREGPNPFDQTSNESLQVGSGVFTSTGRDMGRTGASNARAVGGGGLAARWRSSSQQRRVNLVSLLAVILIVVIVLPMLISFVGANRREALAAADAEGVKPVNVVVIDPAVQAAADTSGAVLGAYAMSSAFVSEDTSTQMQQRIEAVSSSVIENDAANTQALSDESINYFVGTYAPELVAMTPDHKANWSAMGWETSAAIDTAVEQVNANLSRDNLDALAQAVIALATALGNGRDEHFANRVTYVPPAPKPTQTQVPTPEATPEETATPEPTTEPEPTTDPEPTSDPEPTTAPEPQQTNDGIGGSQPQQTQDNSGNGNGNNG